MEEEEITKKLEEHEDRIKKLEEALIIQPQVIQTPIKRERSMREFYNEFTQKTETDKTLIVMRVLEELKGKVKVTAQNIVDGFKEIREKTPQNIFDKLQMLSKKALIMADGKEAGYTLWTITHSGIEYLEKLKNNQ